MRPNNFAILVADQRGDVLRSLGNQRLSGPAPHTDHSARLLSAQLRGRYAQIVVLPYREALSLLNKKGDAS